MSIKNLSKKGIILCYTLYKTILLYMYSLFYIICVCTCASWGIGYTVTTILISLS